MADLVAVSSVWDRASSSLRHRLGEPAWNTWFSTVEAVDLSADCMSLSVPAELYKRSIEERYGPTLVSVLTEAAGRPMQFSIVVNAPRRSPLQESTTTRHFDLTTESRSPGQMLSTGSSSPPAAGLTTAFDRTSLPAFPQAGDYIVPSNTFETFITGESNRFAYAAAQSVAESPGAGYNPLFIYGGTGLGKTHLLHAIVNYARAVTHLRATYVTSEQFTNEFIDMIRSDRRTEFRERYRSTDILLIDDIQFLAGKIETQNEFFHTFNHLHQSNRQIVIVSDRPPKEIRELEDRLRSRFEWGLLTDIQPPDLETRIAILRNKAERSLLSVPDDVIEFIAQRISDNIRELEGALNRVAAYATLEGAPLTRDTAENMLVGIGDAGNRQVTSPIILRETADYYNISLEELLGPSRRRPLVIARQVAMYLHREMTELSLPRIGEIFGGRDHTTVLHANRKIEQLVHERRALLQQVNELANRIKLG